MVERPRISQEASEAALQILCLLHHRYSEYSEHALDRHSVMMRINARNHRIIELALDQLKGQGFVYESAMDTDFNEITTYYSIRDTGVASVDSWSDESYERYSNLLNENKKKRAVSSNEAPASDRTVTLTDNQREKSIEALEGFIEEFRQDHHFGNEWAAEKGVLIDALEIGKSYLENKVINVRIGTMMTIDHLKEIVAKYDQAAVGGTVSAMAQKVIEVLVDLFKNGTL